MIEFDTIKFCRTILVSSCGLKEKSHYNSRASLDEAPTKNAIGSHRESRANNDVKTLQLVEYFKLQKLSNFLLKTVLRRS